MRKKEIDVEKIAQEGIGEIKIDEKKKKEKYKKGEKKKKKAKQKEFYKKCNIQTYTKKMRLKYLLEECDRKIKQQKNRAYEAGKIKYRIRILVDYVYLTEIENEAFIKYLEETYLLNSSKLPFVVFEESQFKITRIFSKYYIRTKDSYSFPK